MSIVYKYTWGWFTFVNAVYNDLFCLSLPDIYDYKGIQALRCYQKQQKRPSTDI